MLSRYRWIGALVFALIMVSGEVHGQSQIRTRMKQQHSKAYKWGKKVRSLPQHAKLITVADSVQYWYKAGIFFRPWWGKFEVVPPPIGIEISARPAGFIGLWVGEELYYYYSGMYLVKKKGAYEIVGPPEGAEVFFLPCKADYKLTLDEREFYWLNGTYYEKIRSETGYPAYRIIGATLNPSSLPSP